MFLTRTLALAVALLLVVPARAQVVDLFSLPHTVEGERKTPLDQSGGKNDTPVLFHGTDEKGKPLTLSGFRDLHCINRSKIGWSYQLDGGYVGFSAAFVRISSGGVAINILGDGRTLFASGPLPAVREPLLVSVDVRDVKTLTFVIDKGADGIVGDRIVVADARLTRRPVADPAPAPVPGNRPPSAVISAEPLEGPAPLVVRFRGDRSADPDTGDSVGRYTWNFGDGATETLAPNPEHTYAEPGLYEVLLVTHDERGATGQARRLVTVRPGGNLPPVAAIAPSLRVAAVGQPITFDASASTDPNGPIAGYTWKLGDETRATGPVAKHAFKTPGRHTVTVTVADPEGKTASRSLSVKILPPTPVPVFPLRKGARVLIIGNSLVGFFGPMSKRLPAVDAISPAPLDLELDSTGKGLGVLSEYATWPSLGIRDLILEGWDVVIVQPWMDVAADSATLEQVRPHAATLVSWIREVGAYPVFLEPHFSCVGFNKQQARAHELIAALARENQAGHIPAGQVWVKAAAAFPTPARFDAKTFADKTRPVDYAKLLYSDLIHQNDAGMMLNTLAVWRYLTGGSAERLDLEKLPESLRKPLPAPEYFDRLRTFVDEAVAPAGK